MAFLASYVSRLFVGNMRFSAQSKGWTINTNSTMLDVSTLENLAKVFAVGQTEGTASLDMFLDTAYATQSQFTNLNTWTGTPTPMTFLAAGSARGSEAWLVQGNQANVTVQAPVADMVGVTVSTQHDGAIDFGVSLADETAITIDTNGTSTDNGAATLNGGVGHLHVTAYSGLTSNSVIIEHSTDNSAWSTLATFTLVTGVTSERLVVAPGTTVNRYLRIRDDVTGAGSCTRFAAFARR